MTKVSNELSSRLANMGLLCAVLVVFQHVGHDLPRESLGWWVQNVLGGGISRIAVPFFFLASGFFLAGHFNERGWWLREIFKRCRTLLVPLLFWSVFGMLWGALWTALANHLAGRPMGDSIPLFHGEWIPGVGILWFIRTLFCLVVVSPLLLWVIRRFGCLAVVGLFAIYWLGNSFVVPQCDANLGDFLFYGVSFEGIAYFSLGLFLRENYQVRQLQKPVLPPSRRQMLVSGSSVTTPAAETAAVREEVLQLPHVMDLKDSSVNRFSPAVICGLAAVAMFALYFSICCHFRGGA